MNIILPNYEKVPTGKNVVRFWSKAKGDISCLSNFYSAEIEFGKYTFPSSEHIWQSQKALKKRTRKRFVCGGDLSVLSEETLQKFYPRTAKEKIVNKLKYWTKDNVGIIAKLASNKNHAKKISIEHFKYEIEIMSEKELLDIWIPILKAKYTQNEHCKQVLLSTGDSYLLEFDRGAVRNNSFWGALNDENGNICGRNFMGECLMYIRTWLQE
jgi:predicted NAD-dependent protein-ADP-ribosyltransferase YbiA (DUF1768 family)